MRPSVRHLAAQIPPNRRWAVACPGQGAKSSLLAPFSAYADDLLPTLDAVEKVLGPEFAFQLLKPTDSFLQLTENAQPAIVATSYAIASFLETRHGVFLRKSPEIAYFLGHLLGEFTAHLLAGTFTLENALRIVSKRAELMQKLVDAAGNSYGMSAVLFKEPDFETIKETGTRFGVLANVNSGRQIVFSGLKSDVSSAVTELKRVHKIPVRLAELPVTIPFHSEVLRPIEPELLMLILALTGGSPSRPVVANLTGVPGTLAETVQATSRPVQWEKSMGYLVENGITDVVNLGPGTVLQGLSAKLAVRQHTLSSPEALAEFAVNFG